MHIEQIQGTTLQSIELNEIDTRAERVCRLMQKAAQHWMEVAREVHDAKVVLSKDAFPLFLQKSQLTLSIANKLLTIAKTTILYEDESKPYLRKLEGWTTLYEVAKLPASEIRMIYDEVERDPTKMITRSFVQKFKSRSAAKNAYTPVAVIAVNEDDVQRLDYDEFQQVREHLNAVQRIIDQAHPALQVRVSTKVLDRLEAIVLNVSNATEPQQLQIDQVQH
jgi:hypothetical protein